MKRPDHLQAIHARLLDWAQYTMTHPHGIATLWTVVASYDGMVSSEMTMGLLVCKVNGNACDRTCKQYWCKMV